MFLAILFVFLQMYAMGETSLPICASIDNFKYLIEYNKTMASTFMTLNNFGLVRCVQQCLFRARCETVNFDISTQICELNEHTSVNTQYKEGSIFTRKVNWPQRLALKCENHACPDNSRCALIETGDGFICITDNGYEKAKTGSYFYKLHTNKLTLPAAKKTCQDEGGNLIILDSAEKTNYVDDITKDTNVERAYIGAVYNNDTKYWQWDSTKAQLDFFNWYTGEPDGIERGEHCVIMIKSRFWRWHDIVCSREYGFICEITY